MEARFVTCRSFQQIKPPEKSLAPSPPTVKGLLSRFGSQAQALFAPKKPRFGSSVAIHKLRETKWFKHDEQNILCAVCETGFILEVRAEDPLPPDSVLSPDYHMYAVAMWKKGKGVYHMCCITSISSLSVNVKHKRNLKLSRSSRNTL